MAGKFKFDFSEVKEKLAKENGPKGFEKDARIWKPVLKDGVCSALIRFLPAPDFTPYVKYLDHSFDYMTPKNEKKRYWKNCINTFGYERECPICKKSWEYHESAFKSDKDRGAELCRKQHFMVNIYVIKHDARPEDNGKVFLYDMAPVISKYNQKMYPTDADKAAPDFVEFVPCDFYEGADFFLTSKKNGEFSNGTAIPKYEDSRFMAQAPFLKGDDDKIEEVFKQVYSLDEFRDESKYPTNEEVIKILGHELGLSCSEPDSNDTSDNADDVNTSNFFGDDEIPNFEDSATPTQSSEESNLDSDDEAFFDDILNQN